MKIYKILGAALLAIVGLTSCATTPYYKAGIDFQQKSADVKYEFGAYYFDTRLTEKIVTIGNVTTNYYLTPEKGNVFVVLNTVATNNENEDKHLRVTDIGLRTDDGNEYPIAAYMLIVNGSMSSGTTFDVFRFLSHGANPVATIVPKKQVMIQFAFQVPEKAQPTALNFGGEVKALDNTKL